SPPDARRPVEVEEPAAPVPTAVLEHEVRVEQDRLDFGEERVVLVDVSPARLDHPDMRIGEMGHERLQKAGRRDETGAEEGDEFAARYPQARFESSRLEA